VTPNARHQGLDTDILEKRTSIYEAARQRNPNRWSKGVRNWEVTSQVYLNPKHSTNKVA
jgi:putative transposase